MPFPRIDRGHQDTPDIPSGGLINDVLAKASGSDGDLKWFTPPGAGGGVAAFALINQLATFDHNTGFDAVTRDLVDFSYVLDFTSLALAIPPIIVANVYGIAAGVSAVSIVTVQPLFGFETTKAKLFAIRADGTILSSGFSVMLTKF